MWILSACTPLFTNAPAPVDSGAVSTETQRRRGGIHRDVVAAPRGGQGRSGSLAIRWARRGIHATVKDALAAVAVELAESGVAPGAPWGDTHRVAGPTGTIGLPGESSAEGIFDALDSTHGWTDMLATPRRICTARATCTSSRSDRRARAWFLDQLEAHAADAWFTLPFHADEIAADPELTTLEL